MATEAVFVTGVMNTGSTGTVDLLSTGFGTATAAIIIVGGAGTLQNPEGDWQSSIGLWTASAQVGMSGSSADGVGTSNAGRSMNAVRAVSFVNNNGNSWVTNSQVSQVPDGIRLTNVSHDGSNAEYISAILIKGTLDAAVVSAQLTSSTTVVTTGHQPDVLFCLCDGQSTSPARQPQLINSFGVVHWDGLSAKTERGTFLYSKDGVGPSWTNTGLRDDACVGQIFEDAFAWHGSAQSRTATGFSIVATGSTGNDWAHFLSLRLADPDDFYIKDVTARTTVGTQAHTGVGFEPSVVGSVLTDHITKNTVAAQNRVGIGFSDGVTSQLQYWADRDGVIGTNSFSGRSTKTLGLPSHIIGMVIDADMQSIDADGWTYDYTTVDGAARLGFAFAIGDSTAGGGPVFDETGLVAGTLTIAGVETYTAPSYTETGLVAGTVTIAGVETYTPPIVQYDETGLVAGTVTIAGVETYTPPIVQYDETGLVAGTVTIAGVETYTAPSYTETGLVAGTVTIAAVETYTAPGNQYDETGLVAGTLTISGVETYTAPSYTETGLVAGTLTISGVETFGGTVYAETGLVAGTLTISGVETYTQPSYVETGLVAGALSIDASETFITPLALPAGLTNLSALRLAGINARAI